MIKRRCNEEMVVVVDVVVFWVVNVFKELSV
jgi:hypothetical protein